MSDDQSSPPKNTISFREFLEDFGPGRSARVKDIAKSNMGASVYYLNLPVIALPCEHNSCKGVRLFETKNLLGANAGAAQNVFVTYVCRNCGDTSKTYALEIVCDKPMGSVMLDGNVYKYGEIPSFGPPTPARVVTLLGSEKEYYLKGRRAEIQGMGIGAFSYYRRVVENQKNRLLDEIIRVAQKIGAPQDMLEDLNKAKEETQFTKAVDRIRHGLPSGLLVNEHNPLTLLHKALSEGLHAQTDEECLALATDIRVVLADLADRLGHALKDRAELDAAVSKLMK